MVPLGLPKCIVGCRTMTAISKSFFFCFKKKSRALWLKKNSGLILASLFIKTLLYLVLIRLIFEFKLKLNFIHLLNKMNINIIFPKFELDLFINNCTFFWRRNNYIVMLVEQEHAVKRLVQIFSLLTIINYWLNGKTLHLNFTIIHFNLLTLLSFILII